MNRGVFFCFQKYAKGSYIAIFPRNFGQEGNSSKFFTMQRLQPTLTLQFRPGNYFLENTPFAAPCITIMHYTFGLEANSSKVFPLQPHSYIFLSPRTKLTLTFTSIYFTPHGQYTLPSLLQQNGKT